MAQAERRVGDAGERQRRQHDLAENDGEDIRSGQQHSAARSPARDFVQHGEALQREGDEKRPRDRKPKRADEAGQESDDHRAAQQRQRRLGMAVCGMSGQGRGRRCEIETTLAAIQRFTVRTVTKLDARNSGTAPTTASTRSALGAEPPGRDAWTRRKPSNAFRMVARYAS